MSDYSQQTVEKELHWSEREKLGYKPKPYEPTDWYELDNAPNSPLEADLDEEKESE